MITNCRIDLTTNQLEKMARHLGIPYARATRKDINEFVQGCIAGAIAEQPEFHVEHETPVHRANPPARNRQGKLAQFVERERANHPDWTESYLRGWCQVKYRKQLR